MGIYAQGYGKGNAHWQASRYHTAAPAVGNYTATSATTTSITVTGAGFGVNAHVGKIIRITSGTLADTYRKVISNTADTFTIDTLPSAPGGTETFSLMTPITILPAKTNFLPVVTGITLNYDSNLTSCIAVLGNGLQPTKIHSADLGSNHNHTSVSSTGWDLLGDADQGIILCTLVGGGTFSLTLEGYYIHKDTPKSYI